MSDLNFSIDKYLPGTRLCPENKHFPYFLMPPFPMFVYLKKYNTFSEYFALVSQKKVVRYWNNIRCIEGLNF